MEKVSIPKSLSKCKIIDELALKSESRTDISINAISILDDFRKRVSEEVRQINELFPEYTPHDEFYHLSELFHIAVRTLGQPLIERLNFSELLILSLSLYGHDWGMAVSQVEKELITNDTLRDGYSRSDFALLPDEHKEFLVFLAENNLSPTEPVPSPVWQEYVRRTHAFRSSERVKKYFGKIHPGIGEAASRVCEGHWLDFKHLEDNLRYPVDFSIMGETVNLKALGVYLRLVDLLDISQGRTPYVIWKYVAPQNARSAMEWKKHRSIHSIATCNYQGGRMIQVEGSTEDHNVYAALMDLKNYCDGQLQRCNDLLHHINDPAYDLNLFGINWRIRAIGFKPISIQFEFNRSRMFEILSDEIYQGDTYIFLREVLQNSIDAIKLRKEIWEKRAGMTLSLRDFGLIEIHVRHLNDGDAEITISDNGTGMDEYIVKNYLSVVGQSYYRSEDFKNLGLKMDPISRFGVGILSCFMVADKIDIETFRDPYLSRNAEKLTIEIPSVTQQFRIQSFSNTIAQPGTQVRIYVSGKKLQREHESKVTKLDVTGYIANIAGFVDIPIKIDEDGVKTLVAGPEDESSAFKYPGYHVQKIKFEYPWEKVFDPQSVAIAKKYYKESILDFQKDLQIADLEGKIICLELIDPKTNVYSGARSEDIIINGEKVICKGGWSGYNVNWDKHHPNDNPFGRSVDKRPQYQVFLDGILIPNIDPPRLFEFTDGSFDPARRFPRILYNAAINYSFLPYILANFQKPAAQKIDLSRTKLVDNRNAWELPIYEKYLAHIQAEIAAVLLQDPEERMLSLGQLVIFRRITLDMLSEVMPLEKLVLPFIVHGGKLVFRERKDYLNQIIYLQPDKFDYFDKLIVEKIESTSAKKGKLDSWQGEEFLLSNFSSDSKQSDNISRMIGELLEVTHCSAAVRFLASPRLGAPPLLQRVYEPRSIDNATTDDTGSIVDLLLDDISSIDPELVGIVRGAFGRCTAGKDLGINCEMQYFQHPFQEIFSYSNNCLNLHHPNTKFLLLLMCTVIKYKDSERVDRSLMAGLIEKMGKFWYFRYDGRKVGPSDLNALFEQLSGILFQLGFSQKNLTLLPITVDSFIPHSISIKKGQIWSETLKDHSRKPLDLSKYSRPL